MSGATGPQKKSLLGFLTLRQKLILGLLLLVSLLFFRFWLWLWWLYSPAQPFPLFVLDKTVLTTRADEHVSLFWVLHQEKYTRADGQMYDVNQDYFGFFPKNNEQFELRDLESLSPGQIKTLSEQYQAAIITDTYGIYRNEWYLHKQETERSPKVYGGLTAKEWQLLQWLRQQGKLVMTEFNFIATPTPKPLRHQVEKALGFKWSGWAARYFTSLNKTLGDLPDWAPRLYEQQYQKPWDFTKAGLVFVHEDERVVVLEDGQHADSTIPWIYTDESYQKRYNLPATMPYPFWVDLVEPTAAVEVISHYQLTLKPEGEKLLKQAGIPLRFPALLTARQGAPYYYMAGDFSDNPVSMNTAHLKGIRYLSGFFYDASIQSDRVQFFWDYYVPFMTTVFQNYMSHRPTHTQ